MFCFTTFVEGDGLGLRFYEKEFGHSGILAHSCVCVQRGIWQKFDKPFLFDGRGCRESAYAGPWCFGCSLRVFVFEENFAMGGRKDGVVGWIAGYVCNLILPSKSSMYTEILSVWQQCGSIYGFVCLRICLRTHGNHHRMLLSLRAPYTLALVLICPLYGSGKAESANITQFGTKKQVITSKARRGSDTELPCNS